jgi:hypothetical protein
VSEVWVLAEGVCGVPLALSLIRGAVRGGTLCPDGVARRQSKSTATIQTDANRYQQRISAVYACVIAVLLLARTVGHGSRQVTQHSALRTNKPMIAYQASAPKMHTHAH